jgi:hypothetical protein
VDVEISRLPDGDIVIDGDCSCPMAFECKHVVAAVLEWSRSTSHMAAVPNATPKRAGPTAPSASPVPVAALSATLQQWLTDLGNDLERAGDPSPQARKRLLYVLDQSPGGVLGVTAMSQELDKVGTPRGSPQSIDPNNAWMTNPAKYLRADDLAILRRLARGGFARDSATHRFVLADAPGAHMLAEIAATGRAHWGSADGKLLRMGEPREGQGA